MRHPKLAAAAALVLPLALLLTWAVPDEEEAPTPRRAAGAVEPPAAPRPAIVPRAEWKADEKIVRESPTYLDDVKAVFLHHTNHPNDYDCADVPGMLRSLQDDHVRGNGWDDTGYNFVVDRCGTVYEGRGGNVDRAVRGAHTKGYNTESTGIGALGTFDDEPPPQAMLDAIARVAAWKLRPGADPHGTVELTSTSSGSLYEKGTIRKFPTLAGHRDGYATVCPGEELYDRLPQLRDAVARLRD
jgi:hypothetical protein